MLNNKSKIYFLTVNYYSTSLILRLIESINNSPNQSYQIVVVNNSPDEAKISQLKQENVIIIESGENLGFGKACNLGLNWIYQLNSQAIVWLINPDAYFLSDNFYLVQQFLIKYPEISILGTEVYKPDGKIWFGWGEFIPSNGKIFVVEECLDYQKQPYLPVKWVTGCSFIINLSNFKDCPYFDHDYFLYYEDFEFCQRYNKQGHLVAITNQFAVIHEPSSITLQYGNLQLIHNIYSYLLSLEKHGHKSILITRFIRMIIMTLLVFPFKPKFAVAKLRGILMYTQRLI